MHYIKCYTLLFLIIPTLFLAGFYSSVSFGATDKTHIITPSKIICCKNDASAASDSTSTSVENPLKKISAKPTQSDEVKTEKTDSTSTSVENPLKKINMDENKIITPSKIICCKNDASAASDSTSTSVENPLKKISTKPTQSDERVNDERVNDERVNDERVNDERVNDERVKTEQSNHEPFEENSNDRNLSDLIQTNLGKLLYVNSDEVEDNNNDNNNDKLDELRTMVSAVLS